MLIRVLAGLLDLIFHPRAYIRRLSAITLALALTGCATTQPLSMVCWSAKLLEESGLCAASDAGASESVALSRYGKVVAAGPGLACPKGKHPEVVNYQRWLEGEEAPRVECRRVTIQ